MTGARACGCRTVRGFTAAESALLKGQGGRVLPIRDVMDVMRNNASSDSKFMMHVFDPEFFNSMHAAGFLLNITRECPPSLLMLQGNALLPF